MTVKRVGFIGLGSQGGPMARRIAGSGLPTTLWARRPESLEPYADTPAETAATPAELAANSDLVCLCVVNDEDVRQVLTGPDGVLEGLAEGGIVAVHSTVHPDTCRSLAAQAAERGVTLIDAPVSGGGPAAEAGRLLVMVGGDEPTVDRVRPVFETYGNPVLHLGPLGAGQLAKLMNNLTFTAHLAVAESAYALGRSLGVDPAALAEVLKNGSGASFGATIVPGAGFSLAPMGGMAGPLLQKDVRLVAELAATAGASPGVVLDAADAALTAMGTPR